MYIVKIYRSNALAPAVYFTGKEHNTFEISDALRFKTRIDAELAVYWKLGWTPSPDLYEVMEEDEVKSC